MTFLWNARPSPALLLQDFCKKAQWRAKKLRERGSNAARQPRKGGGGLPIRSRFGRDSVAIFGFPLGVSRRFVPIPHHTNNEDKTQDTKKARFLNQGIGLRAIARRRELNLRLIPHANTCASARSVLQGRVRQWCIVRPMSVRRHIGRCI